MDPRKTSRPLSAPPVQPTAKTEDLSQPTGTNIKSIESVVAIPNDLPPSAAQANGGEDIVVVLAFTPDDLMTEHHHSYEPSTPQTLSAHHMQATISIPPIDRGERTAPPIPYDAWSPCVGVSEIATAFEDLNIIPAGKPHNISPMNIAFGRLPNLALHMLVEGSLEEMIAGIEGLEDAENVKHERSELELNLISGLDEGEYLFDFSIPWA